MFSNSVICGFLQTNFLCVNLLKSSFEVGPTLDLSAFRKGLEVIVPQPLTIRVPITGYPTPVAKWTFGDKELTRADERVSMETKPTHTELTITPSVRPDKGTYSLQLENDVSSVSGDIDVNVIGNIVSVPSNNMLYK